MDTEPRIAVKIVNGRFVTCWPMSHKVDLGLLWRQDPRTNPHNRVAHFTVEDTYADNTLTDIARHKADRATTY